VLLPVREWLFVCPMAEEMSAMGKRLPFFGVLLASFALYPQAVSAEPFVLTFDVTVTFTLGPLQEIFGTPLKVGDVMRGRVTYDPTLPDRNTIPNFGIFDGSGHVLRLDHGSGLTLPVETYQSFDNANCASGVCDGFLALGTSGAVPGFDLVQAAVAFETAPGREGDSLPSPTELATNFRTGEFRLDAFLPNPPSDDLTHAVGGTVQLRDVSALPVPEPGTLIMVGAGASGLVIRRKRRRDPAWRRRILTGSRAASVTRGAVQ